MKTELLSPAGDLETLKYAINNGADAIYIGGKKFGARAFATNFTEEEIKEAVYLCHLYGVKLYVTLNTVVFENEIDYFLENAKFLYENGVDALIIQDLGMIELIKKHFKDFEIHASTQMHTHNNDCVKILKKLGVSRIVLAREMSLKEIKSLDKAIEKEVFIHGALCVSYSGCCLFSSLNGGRSGNRGACVGSCRLPYKIIKNGKEINDNDYPLSTKDLCSVYNIKELLDAGINSLKIEGRMKSKEYVGLVTKIYRKLIDVYYDKKEIIISEEDINNLKKMFNREFTNGYLFDDNIYNSKAPNHLGVNIGKVIKVNKHKIYIKLNNDLHQEDAIRFCQSNKGMILNKLYNENGLLVNKVSKGSIAIVDNKVNLTTEDSVNITIDNNLNKEIINTPNKKINISFDVFGKINEQLTITISDGINKITEKFEVLEEAKKISTSKEVILEKLSKLGNTPFELINFNCEIENVFIPMTILNEARRILCEKLINERTKVNRKCNYKYLKEEKYSQDKKEINFLVRNEKQLLTVINKADNIYITDFDLYKKYKNDNIYYKVPRINYENLSFENENLLISDLGALNLFKNNNIICDYTLNVCNSESVKALTQLGVKKVTLSPETPTGLINEISKYSSSTEVIVYGKLELMALKTFEYSNADYLKDKFNNLFPIINNGYTSIMHFKNIDLTDLNLNTNLRIELFDEDEKDINKILNKIKNDR